MIPMLPLFIIVLATVQNSSQRAHPSSAGGPLPVPSSLHRTSAGSDTSQSQQNLRLTMQTLRNEPRLSHLVSIGPEIQDYFPARKETVATYENATLMLDGFTRPPNRCARCPPASLHLICDRPCSCISLLAEGLRCQRAYHQRMVARSPAASSTRVITGGALRLIYGAVRSQRSLK